MKKTVFAFPYFKKMKPLKKIWLKSDGKISNEDYFTSEMEGYTKVNLLIFVLIFIEETIIYGELEFH
ncbi:hypothetical protein RDV77_01600 [Porphyromonadaceae sp. NP-X]|nr:hypothetical protein [Porphyromonadaceae sp. NP-X]